MTFPFLWHKNRHSLTINRNVPKALEVTYFQLQFSTQHLGCPHNANIRMSETKKIVSSELILSPTSMICLSELMEAFRCKYVTLSIVSATAIISKDSAKGQTRPINQNMIGWVVHMSVRKANRHNHNSHQSWFTNHNQHNQFSAGPESVLGSPCCFRRCAICAIANWLSFVASFVSSNLWIVISIICWRCSSFNNTCLENQPQKKCLTFLGRTFKKAHCRITAQCPMVECAWRSWCYITRQRNEVVWL